MLPVEDLEPRSLFPRLARDPQAASPRENASCPPSLSQSIQLGKNDQEVKCESGPEGGAKTPLISQKPLGSSVPGPEHGA